MPTDIDIAALVLMESFGAVAFFLAFLFFRQRQRISGKQRAFLAAFNKRLISERGDGKCFSSEWVMDNIVYKRKKVLSATPFVAVTVALLFAIFYYVVGPQLVASIVSFGYASVIALIGVAILLWTDAFEAYSYTNAIHKMTTEQLDQEDRSYIELAREATEKAFLRFFSLGVAFALLGPFIPQIFNGVFYALMVYTALYFQTSEATLNVSAALGFLLVLTLTAFTLLILPGVLGPILIRKGKSLISRMFRRKAEQ